MARINMKAAAAKARKIRKAHPSMKWNNAMSQAMKSLSGKRKKKVGTTKKKSPRKRSSIVRRVKRLHKAEGNAIRSLGSVASHVSSAKRLIENEIGKLETKKFVAKKKSAKRKIAKRIAEKKSQFRKLC